MRRGYWGMGVCPAVCVRVCVCVRRCEGVWVSLHSCSRLYAPPRMRQGFEAIVSLLLARGANVDLAWTNSSTPLYMACDKGHLATATVLLEAGANVNLCKVGPA